MNEIMSELYYIVDNWADQQYQDSEEAKTLRERRYALEDEMAARMGEGGREMLENLADLNLRLADIHDKALFEAAVSLGTEVARPKAAQ